MISSITNVNNHSHLPLKAQPLRKERNDVSFERTDDAILKDIKKEMRGEYPNFGGLFPKIGDWIREHGNKVILAVSSLITITVPGLMVYNNPFTDKSEQDREYMAWRFPISGLAALGWQAMLTSPINTYLDSLANRGLIGDNYNLKAYQTESYIEKKLKQANPLISKEKLAEEVQKKIDLNKAFAKDYINNSHTLPIMKADNSVEGMKEAEFIKLTQNTIANLIKTEEKSEDKSETLINALKKVETLANKTGATAKELLEVSKDKLKRLDIDLSQEILESHIKDTTNNFKNFRFFAGIAINLVVLVPISCTFLNWIYPRFMDRYFPELSETKKPVIRPLFAESLKGDPTKFLGRKEGV